MVSIPWYWWLLLLPSLILIGLIVAVTLLTIYYLLCGFGGCLLNSLHRKDHPELYFLRGKHRREYFKLLQRNSPWEELVEYEKTITKEYIVRALKRRIPEDVITDQILNERNGFKWVKEAWNSIDWNDDDDDNDDGGILIPLSGTA